MIAADKTTIVPMVSVYDGRTCIGFILARGRQGFEAYSADLDSRSVFPTQQAAMAALSHAPSEPGQ